MKSKSESEQKAFTGSEGEQPVKLCACGCGTPLRYATMYVNREHQRRALQWQREEKRRREER
jgi:hypothetical protein